MKRFPIISAGFLGRYSALIGKFPLKGPNHRLSGRGESGRSTGESIAEGVVGYFLDRRGLKNTVDLEEKNKY